LVRVRVRVRARARARARCGMTKARCGARARARVRRRGGAACGAPAVVGGGEEGREVRVSEERDAQLEGAAGQGQG
jgi:hypothetical protein